MNNVTVMCDGDGCSTQLISPFKWTRRRRHHTTAQPPLCESCWAKQDMTEAGY